MVDVNARPDGSVIYWSLAPYFDRQRLLTAWRPMGLESDVPEQRPAVACLRDALQEVFAGAKVLIRPLAAKTGFSVVNENRGEDGNTYSTVLTAKTYGESSAPIFSGNLAKIDEVNASYQQHFGRITSGQMAGVLVRVLQRLGATRLRPTGGVYWLPGSRLGEWEAAMAGVEYAADGGKATGYVIRHNLDAGSVRAIHDALILEVNTEAARLTEEIQSGDLGERAIKSRKQEAAQLREKVAEYEKLLGVGLEQLQATLDRVEQTNAVAALLLAANPFEAVFAEGSHVIA